MNVNQIDTEIQALEEINSTNCFTKICNTQYIFPENLTTKGYSILTLNIRSLKKNINELKSLLDSINSDIDVLVITETWNTEHININIPKYKLIHKIERTNKKGGGICVYALEHINMNIIKDYTSITPDIECIHLETENKLITALYRPPSGNKKLFIKTLEDICNLGNNKQHFLVGDFNIDITSKDFEPILDKGVLPTCNKYTRISNNSKSIIDNIFTSLKNTKSYIIPCSISDHFPIISESPTKNEITKKTINIKKINNETIDNLKSGLRNHDWNQITEDNNIHSAYKTLINKIQEQFNLHIPTIRVQQKPHKQWTTPRD